MESLQGKLDARIANLTPFKSLPNQPFHSALSPLLVHIVWFPVPSFQFPVLGVGIGIAIAVAIAIGFPRKGFPSGVTSFQFLFADVDGSWVPCSSFPVEEFQPCQIFGNSIRPTVVV
jgi:hypothetical protein